MSKSNKDELEQIVKNRMEKKKEELVEKAKQEIKANLTETSYTIIEDPYKKGRNFLIVKLKFDIKTMKALVEDYVELTRKEIGIQFPYEQDMLKHYYDRSKKIGGNNE